MENRDETVRALMGKLAEHESDQRNAKQEAELQTEELTEQIKILQQQLFEVCVTFTLILPVSSLLFLTLGCLCLKYMYTRIRVDFHSMSSQYTCPVVFVYVSYLISYYLAVILVSFALSFISFFSPRNCPYQFIFRIIR